MQQKERPLGRWFVLERLRRSVFSPFFSLSRTSSAEWPTFGSGPSSSHRGGANSGRKDAQPHEFLVYLNVSSCILMYPGVS